MSATWMHLPAVTYLPAGSDVTTGQPAEDVEEGSANPYVVEDGALVLSGDHDTVITGDPDSLREWAKSLLEALPAPESPEHYVTATRDCVVRKVQTYHLPLDAVPVTDFDPDTKEFDEVLRTRGVLVSDVIKDLEDDELVTDIRTHEIPAHEVKRGLRWTEDVARSRKKFALVTDVYVNQAGHILINGVLHLRDDMVAIAT